MRKDVLGECESIVRGFLEERGNVASDLANTTFEEMTDDSLELLELLVLLEDRFDLPADVSLDGALTIHELAALTSNLGHQA